MLNQFVGAVVRYEGQKFLKITGAPDLSSISAQGKTRGDRVYLYIHIPFCRTLCPFCCFNRYMFKEDQARTYFKDLRKELDMYIKLGFKFNDFDFGGGAMDVGLIQAIEEKLNVKVLVPDNPRIIAALGAAVIARDRHFKPQ